MLSPRFWPAAGEAGASQQDETMTTEDNVNTTRPLSHQSSVHSPPGTPARGLSTRRVTSWKQHNSLISTVAEDKAWEQSQQQSSSEKTTALGLHTLTTTNIPRSPTRAYYGAGTPATPATSHAYYSPSPMSADSVRSTAALLPSIQPYVPAEHTQQTPQLHSASTFGPQQQSPWSATTASPLLNNYGWPLPNEQQPQRQQRFNGGNISVTTHGIPPSPRSPRFPGVGSGNGRKPTGSPVESVAIRTTFEGPPKSPRK